MDSSTAVTIESQPGGLNVIYRWPRWKSALFFVASLVFLAYLASLHIDISTSDGREFLPIFLILLLTGLGLAYYGLAGLFNVTVFSLTSQEMTVFCRPFPWSAARKIARQEVSQIFCVRMVVRGRAGGIWFDVYALTGGGEWFKLTSEISDYPSAHSVEQAIEDFWHIQPAHVPGEYRV